MLCEGTMYIISLLSFSTRSPTTTSGLLISASLWDYYLPPIGSKGYQKYTGEKYCVIDLKPSKVSIGYILNHILNNIVKDFPIMIKSPCICLGLTPVHFYRWLKSGLPHDIVCMLEVKSYFVEAPCVYCVLTKTRFWYLHTVSIF